MCTEKLSQNIEQAIARLSTQQQQKLLEFIQSMIIDNKPEESSNPKHKQMGYAGSWKDIDDDVFEGLTKGLISRRKKNKRRNEE